TYAEEYDLEESQDFLTYPIIHDTQHETIKSLNELCDLTEIEVYTQEVSESYKQKKLVFSYLTIEIEELEKKNLMEIFDFLVQKHLERNQGFEDPLALQTEMKGYYNAFQEVEIKQDTQLLKQISKQLEAITTRLEKNYQFIRLEQRTPI
ncbi:16529_t:CDS:2, partial [Funneliformis geosporum]